MKGMQLSVSSVVFVLIGVLVVVVVSSFFIFSSGQQMTKVEAQQAYATSCRVFCQDGYITTNDIANSVSLDKKFLRACQANGVQTGASDAESATYCVKACPCEISSDLEGHRREAVDFLNSRTY